MKSLRGQLVVWYLGSFLATVSFFGLVTYFHLHQEVGSKTNLAYRPALVAKEAASQSEVRLLMEHLMHVSLLYSIPFALAATVLGIRLAQKSIGPVVRD